MIIKRVLTLVILLNISAMFGEGLSKDDVADVSKIQLEQLDFKIVKKVSLPDGKYIEYGEFRLDANFYLNKTINVQYAIPFDKNGKTAKSSDNIVFYAPFIGEKNPLSREEHKWFTEKVGYSLYSFEIKCNIRKVDVRDQMYYYRESGVHDLVFQAQKILEKKYNLKPKKLLIIGESGGGTMGEQLGCYYSDQIDAVAIGGSHRYDFPKSGNNVAWLFVHCTGDFMRLRQVYVLQFYMNKMGIQMLQAVVPPLWKSKDHGHYHHNPGIYSWKLRHFYLQSIVELRDKHNGKLPNFKKWPASGFFGGRKWYYPTEEFGKIWGEYVQGNIQKISIKNNIVDEPLYFIPKIADPKAIVIYIHDSSFDEEVLLIDNLYYFMKEQNAIACSVQVSDNYFKSLSDIEVLFKEVLAKDEWLELPIYVCGLGVGGQLAAVAALKTSEICEKKRIIKKIGKSKITKTLYIYHSRIKQITTINSSHDGPFAKLSIRKTRKKEKNHIPLNMIFSSDYNGQIPKKTKYRKIKEMEVNGSTLGEEWFKVLSKIVKNK